MNDRAPSDSLAELSCPGGGWGYAPGLPPHPVPTCLALLALAGQERYAAVVARAAAWLEGCAGGDGTYRLPVGPPEAAWPTALALLALGERGAPRDRRDAVARGLLALRGLSIDSRGEEEVDVIDGTKIGWAWARGTFSWVEPTAWACLALAHAGQGGIRASSRGERCCWIGCCPPAASTTATGASSAFPSTRSRPRPPWRCWRSSGWDRMSGCNVLWRTCGARR